MKGIKALAISDGPNAISPSSFTVATEDYPLSRRLFFYTPAQTLNRHVQEFIEFALSKDGQNIADQVGFVGQNLIAVSSNHHQRLNFNFRFESGSTHLDNKALGDIDRLVTLLHDPTFAGRTVLLNGYTDNQGNPAKNLLLSLLRAQVVARGLKARGIANFLPKGFGAENPVASDNAPGWPLPQPPRGSLAAIASAVPTCFSPQRPVESLWVERHKEHKGDIYYIEPVSPLCPLCPLCPLR